MNKVKKEEERDDQQLSNQISLNEILESSFQNNSTNNYIDFGDESYTDLSFSKLEYQIKLDINKKDRINKINNWLLELLGEIPYYETDETSLLNLEVEMQQYKKKEAIYKNIENTYNTKSMEYETKMTKLKNLLESVHITELDLDASSQTCLASLAFLATELEAKDTDLESLQIMITQNQKQQMESYLQKLDIESNLNHFNELFENAKQDHIKLKSLHFNLESKSSELKDKTYRWKRDHHNLDQKAKEYENKIKSFKKAWQEKQIDEHELRLDHLIKLKNRLKESEVLMDQLSKQLKVYNELPPDLNLARFQLQVKKEQLERLLTEQETLVAKIIA